MGPVCGRIKDIPDQDFIVIYKHSNDGPVTDKFSYITVDFVYIVKILVLNFYFSG